MTMSKKKQKQEIQPSQSPKFVHHDNSLVEHPKLSVKV